MKLEIPPERGPRADIFLNFLRPCDFHPFFKLIYNISFYKTQQISAALHLPLFIMNPDSPFKLTTKLIKQRLSLIIDHHFALLSLQEQTYSTKILTLNESLLEEWCQLMTSMVYFKDIKKIPVKPIKITGSIKEEHQIQSLPCLQPQNTNINSSNVLLKIEKNGLQVLELKNHEKLGIFVCQSNKLEFKKGTLHRFCTYTTIDNENVVLVGGCRESDPNLKSHDILNLDLVSKEIVKIGELPFGISSHGAVRVDNRLFIVGGNKNFNIVTKKCVSFDLLSKEVKRICDMNYPSASHSLLNWKSTFIYKFGGIGSCFGQWDLSPYIQRYNIERDQWAIINPTIKINQNLLHHYSLMINSLVYISSKDSIVVLGGFDFQQRGSTKMFQIQVKSAEGQANDDRHEIVALGEVDGLKPGGFPYQEAVKLKNQLYALEAIDDGQRNIKVVKIGKNVCYL